LDEIAALARREDAESETGQFIVPKEIVFRFGLRGIHGPFCELHHHPILRYRTASAEAPRKQARGNRSEIADMGFGINLRNI
jgi:hypothetical protein